MKNPDLFATFRIILNMNIYEFSKALGEDNGHIRRWESFRERMMPEKAKIIISKIEFLFKINNLINNVDLKRAIKNFEKLTLTKPEENKIKGMLISNSVKFDIHANFKLNNGKIMNVDFAIPSSETPEIVIEVTKILAKKRKDFIHRVVFLDHKFQLLKIANSEIKTGMVIECDKNYEELLKRIINREVVNADFYLVNSINEIPNKIEQLRSSENSDPAPSSSTFWA